MSRARTSRPHLATAVAIALAVTAAPLAVPAVAMTGAVTAGQSTQQDGVPFPLDATILSSGPTGFLTVRKNVSPAVYSWTRYADGVATVLPGGVYVGHQRTDLVTKREDGVYKTYDMATGAAPTEIDPSGLSDGTHTVRGVAGSTLIATVTDATGGTGIHLLSKPQDTLLDREVTGLPSDAVITRVDTDSPDTAVVLYSGTVDGTRRTRAAIVDIASAAVVEEHDTGVVDGHSDTALSSTYLAWVEQPTPTTTTVAVTRRDTGETRRFPLTYAFKLTIALTGDWVTYALPGSRDFPSASTLQQLTARSLTTGESVKLLEYAVSAASGPDETQLVRGGTLAQGEGLYRIAAGPDGGTPVATLVASTGESTALVVTDQNVPDMIDFDNNGGTARLAWTFDRKTSWVKVVLTHTASKKKWTYYSDRATEPTAVVDWDGTFTDGIAAHNGAYTWQMSAGPFNGIGPAAQASGSFTVTRRTVPHDFTDNGTPDLLARDDSDGRLIAHDGTKAALGTGWNAYDRLVAPGDLAGEPYGDVVARDKSGVLWLHQGTSRALAPRVRVGGGWQIYSLITGGSDLDGDARPDLVATDKAGDLWLYKGTGNATAPFAPRTKIGHGWGVYNKLTATGNIAGGPAGDLVARDTAGVLWLYLGKGDGTFAARTRIGGGWNTYKDIAGIGDVDRDGRPDLLGYDTARHLYRYKGTGDWRTPFAARVATDVDLTAVPFTVF
ncbi:VCBS repeat-containing protein [Streptomyces sp. NPDC005828]|uniref:FG-GAP repeat domain-containing protein n=1 Tax=Streptomyces sp. NPDC005828 TaxID=3157071 RepID=UPI0033C03634